MPSRSKEQLPTCLTTGCPQFSQRIIQAPPLTIQVYQIASLVTLNRLSRSTVKGHERMAQPHKNEWLIENFQTGWARTSTNAKGGKEKGKQLPTFAIKNDRMLHLPPLSETKP
ncbi:hypothetical protein EDD64_1263 [Effusibacillus lacus]|nr:hypothetical protein EDD64_1263 [Effusibacillus lacus]